jgi:hypothetical protein
MGDHSVMPGDENSFCLTVLGTGFRFFYFFGRSNALILVVFPFYCYHFLLARGHEVVLACVAFFDE